jgi:hypothetical protein
LISQRKIWWTTVEASFVVLVSTVRMRINIIQMMCWGHTWSSMDSSRIIDVEINMVR